MQWGKDTLVFLNGSSSQQLDAALPIGSLLCHFIPLWIPLAEGLRNLCRACFAKLFFEQDFWSRASSQLLCQEPLGCACPLSSGRGLNPP